MNVLLDIGAAKSYIEDRLANHCRKLGIKPEPDFHTTALLANGHKTDIKTAFRIKFSIGKQCFCEGLGSHVWFTFQNSTEYGLFTTPPLPYRTR